MIRKRKINFVIKDPFQNSKNNLKNKVMIWIKVKMVKIEISKTIS